MEKATEILDVSDSKEFAEFYNMRSNLDDQLKFVRALSYNRYNGKIYKGAEKFMPIDFCIAKAIELDNPKLVEYFIDQVEKDNDVHESLTLLAKKGESALFKTLMNRASRGIHSDDVGYLFYIGDFSEKSLQGIKKIFLKNSINSDIDEAIFDAHIYASKVASGEEKPTLGNLSKYLSSRALDIIEFMQYLLDTGNYKVADKLLVLLKNGEFEENMGSKLKKLDKQLPLMVLIANIRRNKLKEFLSVTKEITDDMAFPLGQEIGQSKFGISTYDLVADIFFTQEIIEVFRIGFFMTVKSTSQLYKHVLEIARRNRRKYFKPENDVPYMRNHLDDPLAVAVYLQEIGTRNLEPIILEKDKTEAEYLLNIFPKIVVNIPHIFGYYI